MVQPLPERTPALPSTCFVPHRREARITQRMPMREARPRLRFSSRATRGATRVSDERDSQRGRRTARDRRGPPTSNVKRPCLRPSRGRGRSVTSPKRGATLRPPRVSGPPRVSPRMLARRSGSAGGAQPREKIGGESVERVGCARRRAPGAAGLLTGGPHGCEIHGGEVLARRVREAAHRLHRGTGTESVDLRHQSFDAGPSGAVTGPAARALCTTAGCGRRAPRR
jgi:hypothetical protein